MNVKEIIINVSKILELDDVVEYLSDESIVPYESILEDVEKLTLAVNMLNAVVASQYIELKDCKVIEVNSDIVSYSSITDKQIIEVKEVLSADGVPVSYKKMANGIKCSCNKVEITYSYFPSIVAIDDEINYYIGVDILTFSLGVVGQYLFLKGDFEEAYIWDEKFKQTISSVIKTKRKIVMPSKRFL